MPKMLLYHEEARRALERGVNRMAIKRGIDRAVKAVVEALRAQAKPVETKAAVAQVASISAHDESIGQLIADAMDKVGKDGVITVEESKGMETTVETVEGMEFDKGYISPYMVTDPEKMEAVLEDAYILITDKKISAVKDLLPALERIAQVNKPLLVLAEEVEGEALATLVVNKLRGTLQAVAVKAPAFGDRRKAMLQDIAILTGGQVVTEELGLKLENVDLNMMGKARQVKAGKEKTIIIGGGGNEKVGIDIVRRVLGEPLRQHARNARRESSIIVEKVRGSKAGVGFNVRTGEFEDMFKAGIVDPAKLTRSALQNAASVASMLLTTEVLVVDKPEEEKEAGMPPTPPM